MADLLTSGTIGTEITEHLRRQREQIIRSWSESGILDNIQSHPRTNIAQLYESEASYLIKEYVVTGVNTRHQIKKHKL